MDIELQSNEFIMAFPNKEGKWEKHLCSFLLKEGDKCYPNMSDFLIVKEDWREKDYLFDIDDPHIVKSFYYDEVWKESAVKTSHGSGKRSSYFRIIKKL